jgi:hypothetical protein
MGLLLWFYLSGLTILMGAELNSEIEHASAFGKDVGEKVPGARKKIGAAAEREHEARGELPLGSLREDVNCDLDPAVPPGRHDEPGVRPSELLIGADRDRDIHAAWPSGLLSYFFPAFRGCPRSDRPEWVSGCHASGRSFPPHPQYTGSLFTGITDCCG